MATETELLRLALAAYEAAAEPNLWLDFLKRCSEAVSSVAAFLQTHDFDANAAAHCGLKPPEPWLDMAAQRARTARQNRSSLINTTPYR